jgi:cyclopropane fatty-acyl-phospholipid synthase-like methyltransferase
VSDNVWQQFFDGYAPQYEGEVFTKDTEREVAFLLELLDLPSGARILDVGCGTGRHSVALAARGCRMTGLDISAGMLAEARAAAEAAGVEIELLQADATSFCLPVGFDAAICLCEGAFTLIGDDDPVEHDLAILANVREAIAPGAPFVLTASNAMRLIREATPEQVAAGVFDPMAQSQLFDMEWEDADGPHSLAARERGYVPTELALLLRHAGFVVEHLWGGTAGNWGRRPVDLDEYEIMVVARRPREEGA